MQQGITLHEDQWFSERLARAGHQVFVYRVGMPDAKTARIANFGAPYQNDWRIMRVNADDTQTDWSGHHESFEEAIVALQHDFH